MPNAPTPKQRKKRIVLEPPVALGKRVSAAGHHLGLGLQLLFCCADVDAELTQSPKRSGQDKGAPSAGKHTAAQRWARSFVDSDPRRQILEYFRPGTEQGPRGLLRVKGFAESEEPTSTYFSVWRPTSMDAVRMLMAGTATGKSLNIKGKSAKQGIISGFVPFMQIHLEEDKRKVPVPPAEARMRLFFASADARARALPELESTMHHMSESAAAGMKALARDALGTNAKLAKMMGQDGEGAGSTKLDDEGRKKHMVNVARLRLSDPTIMLIDESGFGVDVPQRLVWETYIMRQDITRTGEWESGRGSEPDYMDLNLQSARHPGTPQVVVYQCDKDEPLNPRGLLIAYEEEERVLPVASDFDAFTIGSRGLAYPAFPFEQIAHMESLLRNIERILATPGSRGWSHRWLEVLKGEIAKGAKKGEHITSRQSMMMQVVPEEMKHIAAHSRASYSGVFGKSDARQGEPRYGFGDKLHYTIIEHATHATKLSGAVRHAAECYNFYWPQDLDDEFLVVWEGYKGTPWRYLNPSQLRRFLSARAADGFVFPLNPKWLLCDEGWYDVFQALRNASEGRKAIDAWVPSHLQKQITALRHAYPEGFQRVGATPAELESVEEDYEIAELLLKRYIILRRAKLKLRSILLFVKLNAAFDAEAGDKYKAQVFGAARAFESVKIKAKAGGDGGLADGFAQLSHRLFGSGGAPEPSPSRAAEGVNSAAVVMEPKTSIEALKA